jgi:uncharacterized RDD family membrane protein YckC
MVRKNPLETQESESSGTPFQSWENAGFWWRFFALLVDGAILMLIGSIASFLTMMIFGNHVIGEMFAAMAQSENSGATALSEFGTQGAIFTVLTSLAYLALLLGYNSYFESSRHSATPGKMLLGLRVGTEKGEPLFFSDALIRNIYKHLFSVCTGVIGILAAPLSVSSPLLAGVVGILFFVSALILTIYSLIDPLALLFSDTKQTLHDRWAYTAVYKAPETNRWGRLILSLILVVTLFIGGGVVMSLLSPLFLGPMMKQFESNAIEFQQTLEHDYSQYEETSPSIYTGDDTDTVSARIAKELAKARDGSLSERSEAPPTPTPSPSRTQQTEEAQTKAQDFTPKVDGAAVLARSKGDPPLLRKQKEVLERFSGSIRVGGKTFVIQDVIATLSTNGRVIILNLYDHRLGSGERDLLLTDFRHALEDTSPVLRFKLILGKYGDTCSNGALRKYIIDVNSRKAGLQYNKPFFSFKRGGNQIFSKEYVQFDCLRKPGGYLKAVLRGNAGFLMSGTRVPVGWNSEIVVQFKNTKG